MMLLRIAVILALLTGGAQAQMWPFPGPGRAATGGGGYTGPGDIVASGYAWWGLRAYNAAYAASTGNIADLVAVTGGGAVCTLKAATDGTADLVGTYCGGSTASAACAAASGGSCKVSQLYDQTGGGRHLVMATLGTMPGIVFGSVTGLASNRPAMTFSTQYMQYASAFGIAAQPLTMSGVAIRTSGTSDSGILAGATGNDAEMILRTANTMRVYAGAPNLDVTATDNAWHSFHAVFSGASSAANVDGSNTTGTVGTGAINTAFGIYMGRDSFGGAGNFTGNINEVGVWASALTPTNMSNLSSNQHSYWGY